LWPTNQNNDNSGFQTATMKKFGHFDEQTWEETMEMG